MPARRKPNARKMPSTLDTEQFLKDLKDARQKVIAYGEKWPTVSGVRYASTALTRNIDELGFVLTGDPELFWTGQNKGR